MIEQNPAGATYGWGVVFSDRALTFLAEADPESYADLAPRLETWGDQAIVHRGETVRIDGLGFSGIARLTLLGVLQAPASKLVRLLNEPASQLARVLQAKAGKGE